MAVEEAQIINTPTRNYMHGIIQSVDREKELWRAIKAAARRTAPLARIAAIEPGYYGEAILALSVVVQVGLISWNFLINFDMRALCRAIEAAINNGQIVSAIPRRNLQCFRVNIDDGRGVLFAGNLKKGLITAGDEIVEAADRAVGVVANQFEEEWLRVINEMQDKIVLLTDRRILVSSTRPGARRTKGKQRPRNQ